MGLGIRFRRWLLGAVMEELGRLRQEVDELRRLEVENIGRDLAAQKQSERLVALMEPVVPRLRGGRLPVQSWDEVLRADARQFEERP